MRMNHMNTSTRHTMYTNGAAKLRYTSTVSKTKYRMNISLSVNMYKCINNYELFSYLLSLYYTMLHIRL